MNKIHITVREEGSTKELIIPADRLFTADSLVRLIIMPGKLAPGEILVELMKQTYGLNLCCRITNKNKTSGAYLVPVERGMLSVGYKLEDGKEVTNSEEIFVYCCDEYEHNDVTNKIQIKYRMK